MRNLRLVVRSKCCLETNREQMQIMGMTSLATFLISLINCSFASHVYSLMVYFIADAITPYPQHSASRTHTHTLSLSVCLSAILLSHPHLPFDIKSLASISTLSLITINCSDSHHCFT